MRRRDLVIPISTDKKEVLQIRLRDQVLEEIERCCIHPLQVVKEQRERMLRSGEDAEQAPENQLEPALRVARWQLSHRRLRADNVSELWEQSDHERAVQAKRSGKRGAPGHQFGSVLRQKHPDQVHHGLCQAGVGNVTLVLIELAGRE